MQLKKSRVQRWFGLAALPMIAAVSFAAADTAPAVPTINGFVDTTYNYNFNKPNSQTTELRSFDSKANTFALNAAQLNVNGTVGDAGYVVKFLGGTDATVIHPAGPGGVSYFDLEEAYLTYACPITKINVKAGKFVTLEGIEVIESKDDPTISRGYLFGLAEAYTHTGLLLDRTFGKLDLGLGLVNGWDNVVDNNRGKTVIGKVGLNYGDPLTLTISGSHGPEQNDSINVAFASNTIHNDGNNRDSVDITGVTKLIPKTALWFQANWGTERNVAIDPVTGLQTVRDTWNGFGVQPIVTITDKFSVGARLETFFDRKGSRIAGLATATPDDVSVTNFTITPAYKMTANTLFRVEYRADWANKKIFADEDNVLKKNASTASAEWIVTF